MAHAHVADHVMPAEEGLGVYTQKLGMWIFLCSEIMFFTALIGSYIILRWGAAAQWPNPTTVLNIPVTATNTFILICSSVAMVKAYVAAVNDDDKKLKFWLLMTVIGGAIFVGVQAFEYRHLAHIGFLPSGIREGSELAERIIAAGGNIEHYNQFGSTFYTMTGFHGFHVSCGVVSLAWCLGRAYRGKYKGGRYQGVETVGLYWHFVDLVWIILFTIVYLF